ncbi:hypothetical protein C100_06845 [Sphingobium sp. C100]|nr:hypothetical protein C100_06845 [Sphingobium sp. C100]
MKQNAFGSERRNCARSEDGLIARTFLIEEIIPGKRQKGLP